MRSADGMSDHPIYINARFLSQSLTGVQRYSVEVLQELDDLLPKGGAVALCPADLKRVPDYKNIRLETSRFLRGNLWEQIELPCRSRDGLLFSPANIGPYLHNRQVAVIHDVSVFAYPMAYTSSFRLKYHTIFWRLVETAEHILTVSEFSKGEIQKWLKVPAEKITVTYEGREHIERVREDRAVLPRLGIGEKPFFLVVGSRSLHKNLRVVMQANVLMDRSGFDIVLVGARNDSVFNPVFENAAENVKDAAYLKDGELKALYINASALIFPSLYEGFGLPLLEAMACGCPVLCSNIPAPREICSHAALYFDPFSPADLSDKMNTILGQGADVRELRDKGILRAGDFSWRNTAEIIKKTINGCL